MIEIAVAAARKRSGEMSWNDAGRISPLEVVPHGLCGATPEGAAPRSRHLVLLDEPNHETLLRLLPTGLGCERNLLFDLHEFDLADLGLFAFV